MYFNNIDRLGYTHVCGLSQEERQTQFSSWDRDIVHTKTIENPSRTLRRIESVKKRHLKTSWKAVGFVLLSAVSVIAAVGFLGAAILSISVNVVAIPFLCGSLLSFVFFAPLSIEKASKHIQKAVSLKNTQKRLIRRENRQKETIKHITNQVKEFEDTSDIDEKREIVALLMMRNFSSQYTEDGTFPPTRDMDEERLSAIVRSMITMLPFKNLLELDQKRFEKMCEEKQYNERQLLHANKAFMQMQARMDYMTNCWPWHVLETTLQPLEDNPNFAGELVDISLSYSS